MLTLAQSIDPKVWFYFMLLLGVIFVGTIAIFAFRRSLFSQDDSASNTAGGGLLEHLDEMRRKGQITNEEYESTRRTIIERASTKFKEDQAEDDASASGNEPPTPGIS